MKRLNSVSFKILLPIIIVLLIGIGVIVTFGVNNQNQQAKQNEETLLENMYANFLGIIREREQSAAALAASIAGSEEVQKLFAEKDRQGLIDLLYSTYEDLNANHGVYQAQFHLAPATSFLRLHKLEKFGDDLSATRLTIVKSNTEKVDVQGLESGLAGFGIRGVTPMYYNGRHIGAFEIGMGFDKNLLDEFKLIYGKDTTILIPDLETEEEDFIVLASTTETPIQIGFEALKAVFDSGENQVIYTNVKKTPFVVLLAPIKDYKGEIVALIVIENERTATNALIQQNTLIMSGLGVLVLAIMFLFVVLTIRTTVTKPLAKLKEVSKAIAEEDLKNLSTEMGLLANGDLKRVYATSSQKLVIRSGDEIGQVRSSFNTIIEAAQECASSFSKMASNLNQTISCVAENAQTVENQAKQLINGVQVTSSAAETINKSLDEVTNSLKNQGESIQETNNVVFQMAHVIEDVAQGAQEQALAIQTASSLTRQMIDSITQVDGNAQMVVTDSFRAAESARLGTAKVRETITSMQEMKDKVDNSAKKTTELGLLSNQIGMIVETIEDISSQTNLLALNAAIEAARAGESGKGFAVVADEVRKLAERASTSTKEIGQLIQNIQTTVNDMVKLMNDGAEEAVVGVHKAEQAGVALDEISQAAEAVTVQAGQAASAVNEMKKAAEEMERSVLSVSAVIEQNTAAMEEMAASSNEVSKTIEHVSMISEDNTKAIETVGEELTQISNYMEELSTLSGSLDQISSDLNTNVEKFEFEANC